MFFEKIIKNGKNMPSRWSMAEFSIGTKFNKKMKDGGAFATFKQDSSYGIKNAPFDVYVKYEIDQQDEMKVMSKENTTIDNETAVKISGDGINSFSGIKFVQYFVTHDNKPYLLAYMADVKDYEKYLPQFEQMIKTFKFTK